MPAERVAEIAGGVLETFPRPAFRHARAAGALLRKLGDAFDEGSGGPGGWVILFEPELHLGADVLVPDVAGWRRERMPEMPDVDWSELAPDWLCEVQSPSTARWDRAVKLPIYAREGVSFVWVVDPLAETLEVLQRGKDGKWIIEATFEGAAKVRAVPFEALELDLAVLWAK